MKAKALVVATIFAILGVARAFAADTVPSQPPGELVERQLIILFDQDASGTYSGNSVVAAVRAPKDKPDLYDRVGSPIAATKLLEGQTSKERQG